MASLLSFRAAAIALLFFLNLCLLLPTSISSGDNLRPKRMRNLLSVGNEDALNPPILKSKSTLKKKPLSESLAEVNKTKSLKPKKTNSTISSSSSNIISAPAAKIKLNKTLSSSITKSSKLNKTLTSIPTPLKPKLKPKLNKTSIASVFNDTKLPKPVKPFKSNTTKSHQLKSPNPAAPKTQTKPAAKDPPAAKPNPIPKPSKPKPSPENWLDDADIAGEDDDFMAEFRDLPSRLHSAIVPDLHKLSTTSKLYLSKTHREIAAGVKPFVGKYAPSIASAASAALVILPLLLVTVLFRHLLRIGSSASLYRALLFVQAYLAIYFATLSLTAVSTGLEPLRFFHAASPGAYAWTQAVQTFGYVVYLIAQLIALVVAFSAGDGEGTAGKAVSLAQMLLGLAVGMHYYITVFHRAVTGDAPRANSKVHGIYAACFVVICGLGRADRRKKAYMQVDGGDDGKKS